VNSTDQSGFQRQHRHPTLAVHSSMSPARNAAQPQLASHMLEDDSCADAGLSSDSEGDPDDDSVDGMFHAAADAVAAAVAASPSALQQDDKLQLYGLYKQVGYRRVISVALHAQGTRESTAAGKPMRHVSLIKCAALCSLHGVRTCSDACSVMCPMCPGGGGPLQHGATRLLGHEGAVQMVN
jgi:hypothetical protein